MRTQVKFAKLFVLVLLGTGAAAAQAANADDTQAGVIGIEVELEPPIGMFSQKPDRIYFVRIDAEGELAQHQVIPSSLAKDGRVYLLGAKPGRYAAVAAFRAQAAVPLPFGTATGPGVSVSIGRTGYTTYFAKDLIDTTRVELGSGGFAFMGSYRVKQSVGLQGAEPIQAHYAELISPGASKTGAVQLFGGDYHFRGVALDTKPVADTRTDFLSKAQRDLAESEWRQVLK
jgi:hypothetical protein